MTVEELFVNAFDSTFVAWTESGSSPYLDDSDDYIYEAGTGADQEGYFDFANSGVGAGVINSVNVSLECKWGVGTKKFYTYIWDGTDWIDFGTFFPTSTYAWHDIDISASIDSWAKINSCRVYFMEITAAPSYVVYIRRCKLKIDYTAVGGLSIPVAMRYYRNLRTAITRRNFPKPKILRV